MKLTDFKALTFDCYGTLIDWESGMVSALKSLTDRAPVALTRDQILEAHGWHESRQQKFAPATRYRDLLAVVHKRLAEEWRTPASWDESVAYGNSVGDWPAFPDTPAALQHLKQHFKLIILSNVDNESFAASNRRLGVEFDAICTAEDIGSYKPDLRNFEYLLGHLERLGISKGEVLHVAESLFHDHVPANKLGLASCWIHRRHDQQGFGATMTPETLPRHDFRFTSLAGLAAAHAAELGK